MSVDSDCQERVLPPSPRHRIPRGMSIRGWAKSMVQQYFELTRDEVSQLAETVFQGMLEEAIDAIGKEQIA